jgi:hypothetical protein
MRSCTLLVLVALAVGLTACQDTGPPGAGRTSVPSADASPPTVTLTAWATAADRPRVAVRSSGIERRMTLRAKTGALELVATATDPESGVQAVEIWVSKFSSFCGTATCTGGEPAVTAPRFAWAAPRRHPGADDRPGRQAARCARPHQGDPAGPALTPAGALSAPDGLGQGGQQPWRDGRDAQAGRPL